MRRMRLCSWDPVNDSRVLLMAAMLIVCANWSMVAVYMWIRGGKRADCGDRQTVVGAGEKEVVLFYLYMFKECH
jgi:hypothetical protein